LRTQIEMKKPESVGSLWKRVDDLGQNIKELNDKTDKYSGWIREESANAVPNEELIKEWRERIKEWRAQIKMWDKQAFALEEDTRRRMDELRLEPRLLGMLFVVVECCCHCCCCFMCLLVPFFRPSESCAKVRQLHL
jgi:hypothetical protein